MTPQPRATHDDATPAVHGGIDSVELAQFGLRPDQVLDFSSNVNPFGSSPAVRRAAQTAAIDRYPDRTCVDLRRELARRHGVAMDEVLVGNGSSELIWLIAVAYLAKGDEVVILGPAFSEYERSVRMLGANARALLASVEDGFRPPVDQLAEMFLAHSPRVVFLASPNNPTGQSVAATSIHALARRHRRTLFVLDEAYAACLPREAEVAANALDNVVRLRSLTKAHGLAGLRLGYALGTSEVIAALRAVQPPWSVNGVAQVAGVAALADEDRLKDDLHRWADAKNTLVNQLAAEGFAPVPSEVPFFLLPVGNAAQVRALLLGRGLLVRDCASFGLPEYIRICARRPDENARLLEALAAARAEARACPV